LKLEELSLKLQKEHTIKMGWACDHYFRKSLEETTRNIMKDLGKSANDVLKDNQSIVKINVKAGDVKKYHDLLAKCGDDAYIISSYREFDKGVQSDFITIKGKGNA